MVQAERSGQATERYTYDPEGRRIEKSAGGAVTRYLYSGMQVWAEYGDNWADALAHYTYTGLDEPAIRATPNAADTLYYHQDGLGSAVAVTGPQGATAASARYDAWGNVLAASGSIPRFGYTGREPDASGLIYYRARYYDPTVGRFTQRDPAGFVDGVNRYAYVGQSPVNFVDPLGLMLGMPGPGESQGSGYPGNTGGGYFEGVASRAAYDPTLSQAHADCLACHGNSVNATDIRFAAEEDQHYLANVVLATAAAGGAAIAAEAIFGSAAAAVLMMSATGEPPGGVGTRSVHPNTVRFSQRSVNGTADLVDSMRANGWKGDAIDVVRMNDGGLTALDNTRVLAASRVGTRECRVLPIRSRINLQNTHLDSA